MRSKPDIGARVAEPDPSAELKAENARLVALLEANGIQWRVETQHEPAISMPEPLRLSTGEKVALFRRLFRGRTDVYPIRWESKTTAKAGYSPARGLSRTIEDYRDLSPGDRSPSFAINFRRPGWLLVGGVISSHVGCPVPLRAAICALLVRE